MKNLNNQVIHFIGIGGISMSALAIYIHNKGYKVQGSDKCYSKKLAELEKSGIKTFVGHSAKNISNATICVYTSAIDDDNPELVWAKQHCTLIERGELLGKICKAFKNTIAVSGTHGKTTVTAMIGQCLCEASYDPTIHIGGNFKYIGGNFRYGASNYFVTEACEYQRAFLHIAPQYLIINNVELDHLDCYNNLSEIEDTFLRLARQVEKQIIINGDSEFYQKHKNALTDAVTFGTSPACTYQIKNLKSTAGKYTFDVIHDARLLTTIDLNISGIYNAYNALACVTLCNQLSIPREIIKCSLAEFNGVERRLEVVLKTKSATVIKDYAHHPTEIRNAIQNVRELDFDKIVVVFQPHTYTRTLGLFEEFLSAFGGCDAVIFLPTYPAREKIIIGGRSEDLFAALKKNKKNCHFADNFAVARDIALQQATQNACILLLGAGDVENVFSN